MVGGGWGGFKHVGGIFLSRKGRLHNSRKLCCLDLVEGELFIVVSFKLNEIPSLLYIH